MPGDTRHRNRSGLGRWLAAAAAVLFAFAALPGVAAARSTPAETGGKAAAGGTPQPLTAEILVVGPRLSVSPAVGPPGTVAIVRGTGFASLRPVILQWSDGIPYTPFTPIVTHDDGTFTAQMLVVSGDGIYGGRFVVAYYNVLITDRVAVARAVARVPFTVIEHSAGPPSAAILRTYWGRRPVILRH